MAQTEEKGKLFVGGLSWETTQASLMTYFSKFGEVQDCVVITNPATGKSRGFGFVTFKDPACVDTVQAAGPHILDGKQIDPNGCNRKKVPKGAKGAENCKKKLFVGGLPANIDEAQLREGFGSYGKINEVVIVYDQQKQKPRGFGFLTFESEDSVDKIVKERFVLLNGKQVECKRAEARETQMPSQLMNTIDGSQGLMMLAQGPDGVIGLVPAATQHPGLVYNSAGGLVTPTELASAYRGLIPGHANMAGVGMPSEVGLPGSAGLSGLKYISQPVGSQQYIMLGGASPSPATGTLGGAGGYIVQGGSAGGAGGLLVHGGAGAGVNGVGGLVMAGAAPGQTGGVLVAAPGGGSYFVHCNSSLPAVANGGSGGYILTGGAGTGGGILVQGGAGGQQYLMQYPGGGASLVQAANQAYDFGGGVGLQQAIHSNKISAFSKNSGQLSDGEKSSNIIAAPSYSVINPYTGAAIGIVGGASSASVPDSSQQLDEPPLRLTSSNQQDPSTPSTSTAQATPKVGYYIVPSAGMVGGAGGIGLSGYTGTQYGSPIFAATDPNQATIIAAPSLTPYGRVASNHASIAQGYHPYRR